MQNELFNSTFATHYVEKTILLKTEIKGDCCTYFSAFLVCLKEFIRVFGTKGETIIRLEITMKVVKGLCKVARK